MERAQTRLQTLGIVNYYEGIADGHAETLFAKPVKLRRRVASLMGGPANQEAIEAFKDRREPDFSAF